MGAKKNPDSCIGATFRKSTGRWECRVRMNNKVYWLGHYTNREIAGRIYDVAAIIVHGPGQKLNYEGNPPEGYTLGDIMKLLLESGLPRDYLIRRLTEMAGVRTES